MRVITLLDTATASTNLGDQIIMAAVRAELEPLTRDAFVYTVASHERLGPKSRSLIARSDRVIVGGTNLLSSRMWFRPLWKLTPFDLLRGYGVTLMGVGWYQFQRRPDLYSRTLLRRVLSPRALHSVRDGYTRDKLRECGIENVVNTGCPTLWSLGPDRCAALPRSQAAEVVTTLNTYIPDRTLDGEFLRTLRRHYSTVHFWSQTEGDRDYARSLDPDLVHIEPSLAGFDRLLESSRSLDYVGNRLHAGIRALQKGRRSIIVEIDNRAREMGHDFGLPTLARDRFEDLSAMIESELETDIRLPGGEIERWQQQLRIPGQDAA